MFGGNSNWRGPIWFPVNSLLIDALRRRHTDSADAVLAEVPTGSDRLLNLGEVAADLEDRLIALFLPGGDGRAPGTPRDFGAGPLWDRIRRSASTSTATPAKGWAPPIRRAGPRWSRR